MMSTQTPPKNIQIKKVHLTSFNKINDERIFFERVQVFVYSKSNNPNPYFNGHDSNAGGASMLDPITSSPSSPKETTANLSYTVRTKQQATVTTTNSKMQRTVCRYSLAVATIAIVLLATLVAAKKSKEEGDQCGMYMAISSTSTVDDTKWGLYAGQEIPADSPIGYPDIAINIFNLQGNAHLADENEDDLSLVAGTVEFFEQFIWVPLPSGGHFELEEGRAVTAIPGAGVLGGFNPKLTNADWNHSSAYFRPAMGEQPTVNHPGRGAYTNFFNVGLRSKEVIQAGREIFLDYGENWESEAEEEDLTADDFKKLDATVEKMASFFEKYEGDLDEKAKIDIYDFLIRDVMGAAAGSAKGKKILDLLPSYPDSLSSVKESGGALAYSQPKSQRSAEWLQSHGRCIDNIRPGASKIPDAGTCCDRFECIHCRSGITRLPKPVWGFASLSRAPPSLGCAVLR